MRIVIDFQAAQASSRFDAVGQHILSFARAIILYGGNHEVILALSNLFPESIEPMRAEFGALLPQENIVVWDAPAPIHKNSSGNAWHRHVAERIWEGFMGRIRPDVIHLSSLFGRHTDNVVSSLSLWNTQTVVTATLHGVSRLTKPTPETCREEDRQGSVLRELLHSKNALRLFTLTHSGKQEAVQRLKIPEKNIRVLGVAVPDPFRPLSFSQEEEGFLHRRFAIRKPFILCAEIPSIGAFETLLNAYALLPEAHRRSHQLVSLGTAPDHGVRGLLERVGSISEEDIVFTGQVTDQERLRLYNLSRFFISLQPYEDGILSIIEAMACGSPVVAPSVPVVLEIMGLEGLLFDPYDAESLARALKEALENDRGLLERKERYLARVEKFSWKACADAALEAWESLRTEGTMFSGPLPHPRPNRPKLAYISPLPPEMTGISDYSAELLPELKTFYDIEAVVAQETVTDCWVKENVPIRDVAWFQKNFSSYDRVLYHVGNSPYHVHMFPLLEDFPGVVVLHDFFLSHAVAHLSMHHDPLYWPRRLYESHGYKAVQEFFISNDKNPVLWNYPCNLHVLQNALGIIVHSEHAKELEKNFYANRCPSDWAVVPHLRRPVATEARHEARAALGLSNEDFLVCTFGVLGPSKLNHRLLDAWLASSLSKNPRCRLIFVGKNCGGEYGSQLVRIINESQAKERIHVTGWVDTKRFRFYLASCDIAVQLRTLSRGESSYTVLDCMNYGVPTIVNAHGSMAELPHNTVWMLPDAFENQELTKALESLWENPSLRRSLGDKARAAIFQRHNPSEVAKLYAQGIEKFYDTLRHKPLGIIRAVAAFKNHAPTDDECLATAQAIARSLAPRPRLRQILLDVTGTAHNDLKTGIERAARALIKALIASSPPGYRVEPVYLSNEGGLWHYRYARSYTLHLLGCSQGLGEDEPAEAHPGDILIGLDISGEMIVNAARSGLLAHLKNMGVKTYFMVYDLLPLILPQHFPPGEDRRFKTWIQTVSALDGALCDSKATADSLAQWLEAQGPHRRRPFKIAWVHLGADVEASCPTCGLPSRASRILRKISQKPSFLMVGTIEPRKGHLQTLAAFTSLWNEGLDITLVIVGKEGWKGLPEASRRTIPQITHALRSHPERDKRLFWLEGISDEFLEKVYAASTCLLMASEGEGFGLPLIEAARHKRPIIARDIPVFREVARHHAFYFADSTSPAVLADAVKTWLALYNTGAHPRSDHIPHLTWQESARTILDIVLNNKWPREVMPDGWARPGIRYAHDCATLEWGKGWSFPEEDFRWTDGQEAEMFFHLREHEFTKLTGLRIKYDAMGDQTTHIFLNNVPIFSGILTGTGKDLLLETAHFRPDRNRVLFQLPEARQPGNGDPRWLALALREFQLLHNAPGVPTEE